MFSLMSSSSCVHAELSARGRSPTILLSGTDEQLRGVAGGGRGRVAVGRGGGRRVLLPPPLPGRRQAPDRVVVLVLPGQGVGVGALDAGAVVLRPVRDAAHRVVPVE